MPVAEEFDQIAAGLLVWQVYDPAVKADLSSAALETPAGTYLVDPVELGTEAMQNLEERQKITGIILTNENHERAASRFARRFSAPIYIHADLGQIDGLQQTIRVQDREEIAPGLSAITIDGGPAGEIAVYYNARGGTMVLGDALINFEPYGFALLPAKYCRDFKVMRRSLRKLLDYAFERMLFAHGTPILSGARVKLEQLLAANP